MIKFLPKCENEGYRELYKKKGVSIRKDGLIQRVIRNVNYKYNTGIFINTDSINNLGLI